MLTIANKPTADDYTAELTMESELGGRLVYLVANQSVAARFRPLVEHGGSGAAEYGPEQLLTPQSGVIDKISAAKFRSAVAGSPARIIAQLTEPGDILPAAGTPFTQSLSATGSVSGLAGTELAYNEFTADVTVGNVNEGSAATVVTATAIVGDGLTAVIIEFFAELVEGPVSGNTHNGMIFVLYQDGVSIGLLGQVDVSLPAGNARAMCFAHLRRRMIPAAGSRTYSIRAFPSVPIAGGAVRAGAGGSGNRVPGYIRIAAA